MYPLWEALELYHDACDYGAGNEMALKLLEKNVKWNYEKDKINTLFKAIYYRRFKVAMKLIEKGIDLNFQNEEGETALVWIFQNEWIFYNECNYLLPHTWCPTYVYI